MNKSTLLTVLMQDKESPTVLMVTKEKAIVKYKGEILSPALSKDKDGLLFYTFGKEDHYLPIHLQNTKHLTF